MFSTVLILVANFGNRAAKTVNFKQKIKQHLEDDSH